MFVRGSGKNLLVKSIAALAMLAMLGGVARADDKKPTPPPAKPAAKSAAPASKAGGAGGAAASKGPTTASKGPTTGGAAGATTASRTGVTTTSPRTTTAAPAKTAGLGTTTSRTTTSTTTVPTTSRLPAGSRVVTTPGGQQVRLRSNGRPAEIHTKNGSVIHEGLNGHRSVMMERRDGSRVYAERGGRGYVEHPFRYGNREFGRRSYYYNGRAYDRYYGRYYYRGGYLNYYTPGFYYGPAFYGWAYNPWIAPVSWAWGWGGSPWFGFYGGYFAPYPVYASASLWLTDYLISTSLTAAYQAQLAAAASAGPLPPDADPLTPEVKNLISAEVQRQIALENAEAQSAQAGPADPASSSIQRMMTDGVQHVFVVGSSLDVVDATGRECAVSQGDAIQLAGPPPPDATAATLVVLSSKGGPECRRNSTIMVQFADLQEMQNHMRETIDDGMADLKAKKVRPIPQAAAVPVTQASFVTAAPPPDPNAATEINQQMQDADQAEKDALSQAQQTASAAPPPPIAAPAAPPVELKLGLTIDEVTAANGVPTKIVDLGAKKIYYYKDMKVTFKDGKVVDIN
jgi:hypothetical protein